MKGHRGLKPKGSRTRAELTKAFITDVANHWEVEGRAVLERLAQDNPAAYARVVAQVIPRDDSLLVTHDGQVTTKTVNVNFMDVEDKPQVDQGVTLDGDKVH